MTRVIAVAMTKGGVGKTTTAVNLGAGLAMRGRRVLIVDTDTQGQVADALGLSPAVGLAEAIRGDMPPAEAVTSARPGLDLLAGGPDLAGTKRDIARRDISPERTMGGALGELASGYDYVLIDTAPAWDTLQINVLFFAGEVLAPVTLDPMTVKGLVNFMARLQSVQRHHGIQLSYVLPVAMDRRVKQTAEILERIRDAFGDQVSEPIRYNIRLSEAPAHGEHIFEYDPNCPGAVDYARLADEVIADE